MVVHALIKDFVPCPKAPSHGTLPCPHRVGTPPLPAMQAEAIPMLVDVNTSIPLRLKGFTNSSWIGRRRGSHPDILDVV